MATFAATATVRCDHDWQEAGSADFSCSKCSAWYSYEGSTEEERYTPGKAEAERNAAIDHTPQALADTLDRFVATTLESDREVASALIKCREALRAISWERFRIRHEESSRRRVAARRRAAFVTRHQCRQGGRNHA